MSGRLNLRFGIPSLDAIFRGGTESDAWRNAKDISWGGISLSTKNEATSLCIIGPDGTGKSVFSLHLASEYFFDARKALESGDKRPPVKIIYVSTDLRFEMAERMFDGFRLGEPVYNRRREKPYQREVELVDLPTANPRKLAEFLIHDGSQREVGAIGFVDLASDSAGDDWAMVNRIVSLLEQQEDENRVRHLLVVDAVEGIETLSGETDAYGQKVSRRARIALLMRLSSRKCHTMLIVEESKEGIRLPEEFVADVVVRLRSTLVNGYTRRTLEIEKARGLAHHARGQHPFQIRSRRDSETPPQSFDRQLLAAEEKVVSREPDMADDARIVVYPSLHYQGNVLREESRREESETADAHSRRAHSGPCIEPPQPLASFGILHLDDLLKDGLGGRRHGLPGGMPFAIVGEKGSFKSQLADAFLSRAVADVARSFRPKSFSGSDENEWLSAWADARESAGVAILCSSKPRSLGHLSRFRCWRR